MAVRIANLKILVTASTRGLVGGMSRAGRSVAGFGRKVSASLTGVKAMAAGLAGLVGVTLGARAAINTMRQQFEAIDKLAKTASKIGVTTQALEKMRFAAKLSGVEITTTDMALQRFTRRTAEAAVGTGEAQNAFHELGIDAARFSRLPLEKQMLELANSFQNFSDADQLRLAFKLFDSEGAALVNTLKAGGDALDEMFKERAGLGLFSDDQVSSIESANDSITKFGIQLNFIKGSIAADLSDTLGEVVDKLKEMNAQGGDSTFGVAGKLKGAAKGLALASDVADTGRIGLGAAGLGLEKGAAKVGLAADRAAGVFGLGLTSGVKDFLLGIEDEADKGLGDLHDQWLGQSATEKVNKFFDGVDKRGKKTGEKLKAALDPTLDPRSVLLPQARLQGSAAALSFSAQREAKSKNALARIAKASEDQVANQEEVAALLGDIEKNTRGKLKAAPL